MLTNRYLIFAFVHTHISTLNAFYTQICEKQNDNPYEKRNITRLDGNTPEIFFIDFIENTNIWIDKSLFINTIIEHEEKIIIIHSPELWFTWDALLPMLQTYLAIVLDKQGERVPTKKTFAYSYFINGEIPLVDGTMQKVEPVPLISYRQDLINEVLGQHPVIYLRFLFPDVQIMLSSIANAIGESMDTFGPLINKILQDTNISSDLKNLADKCVTAMKFSTSKLPTQELLESVRIFSKLLYTYFGKKVVIILAEYDCYLEKLYFGLSPDEAKSREENVLKIYRQFSHYAFHSNEYLEKAIITIRNPVASILGLDITNGTNTIKEYNFIDGDDIYTFIGHTEPEVFHMMSVKGFEYTKRNDIVNWYGGYFCPKAPSGHIFIHFVENFLRHRTFGDPYQTIAQEIIKMKKYPPFCRTIQSLANHQIKYTKIRTLQVEDFRSMNAFRRNTTNTESFTNEDCDTALVFLCSIGYLTVDTKFSNATHVGLKVPNQLIADKINHYWSH